MSDDCNSFYNGFMRSEAQKLLCSFHITQAIKRNGWVKLKQEISTESIVFAVRTLCGASNLNDSESKHRDIPPFLSGEGEKDTIECLGKTLSDRLFAGALRPHSFVLGTPGYSIGEDSPGECVRWHKHACRKIPHNA
ncbi:hypothetical protein COOONC_20211 [Cooperia oncophora]